VNSDPVTASGRVELREYSNELRVQPDGTTCVVIVTARKPDGGRVGAKNKECWGVAPQNPFKSNRANVHHRGPRTARAAMEYSYLPP
jgi:hypothetical protein